MKVDKVWLLCPLCNEKTRIQVSKESVLEKFILFCPKCKKETIINVKQYRVTIE